VAKELGLSGSWSQEIETWGSSFDSLAGVTWRAGGHLEGPIAGEGSEYLIAGRHISHRAAGRDKGDGGGAILRQETNPSHGMEGNPRTGVGLGDPDLRGPVFGRRDLLQALQCLVTHSAVHLFMERFSSLDDLTQKRIAFLDPPLHRLAPDLAETAGRRSPECRAGLPGRARTQTGSPAHYETSASGPSDSSFCHQSFCQLSRSGREIPGNRSTSGAVLPANACRHTEESCGQERLARSSAA
jgi:hypothetical protein